MGGSAALTVEGGKNALICFGFHHGQKRCELFVGEYIIPTSSSRYGHWGGRLGFYKGKPTTVGSQANEKNKVETLGSTGWSTLTDFPERFLQKFLFISNF